METFTLSRKELHRPGLLKAALGGRLTNRQVAVALGLTVRHVRRLKRRLEAGGAPALGHRSRGRPSPRRLPPALRAEVLRLMTTVYEGANLGACHSTGKHLGGDQPVEQAKTQAGSRVGIGDVDIYWPSMRVVPPGRFLL